MPGMVQFGDRVYNLKDAREFRFIPKGDDWPTADRVEVSFDRGALVVVKGDDAMRLWAWLEMGCGTRSLPIKDGAPTLPSPSRPLIVEEEANPDPTGQHSPPCFARPTQAQADAAEAEAFVSLDHWDACSASRSSTAGRPVYAGLILSSVNGLAALVWIAGDPISGFDLGCQFYLPQAAVDRPENHGVPYRDWAEKGLVTLTPGDEIDHAWIRSDVNDLAAGHDLVKLAVDPYNAWKLVSELRDQDGLPVEHLRQDFPSLTTPTKSLVRLVQKGRIRHGGNPILRWCVNNAVTLQDGAGGLKISAKASHGPVAGVSALVNAIAAVRGPKPQVKKPGLSPESRRIVSQIVEGAAGRVTKDRLNALRSAVDGQAEISRMLETIVEKLAETMPRDLS